MEFKHVMGLNTSDLVDTLNKVVSSIDQSKNDIKISYNDKLTHAIIEIRPNLESDEDIVAHRLSEYVDNLEKEAELQGIKDVTEMINIKSAELARRMKDTGGDIHGK